MLLVAVVLPFAAAPAAAQAATRRCAPPRRSNPRRLAPRTIDSLAGTYDLTVIGSTRGVRPSITRGILELWRPDSAHRFYTLSGYNHPLKVDTSAPTIRLAGATTVDLRAAGALSIRHSLASRDPDQPGVQVDGAGEIVFGNSMGPRGLATDSGIFFDIHDLDPHGFAGTWVDGGNIGPLPHGYFCARRRERRG